MDDPSSLNSESLNSHKKTVTLPPSGKRAGFNDAGPALQSPRWEQERVSPRRSPRENRVASDDDPILQLPRWEQERLLPQRSPRENRAASDDSPEPQSSRMRIRMNDRGAESLTNRQVPFNQVDSQPRFVAQTEQVRLLLFSLRVVN